MKLPAPTENAADIAKLTTGLGSALISIWFPATALVGPAITFAIDKFVERPKRILLEELKAGNLETLTAERAAEFIPMAYRFLEAGKEGEYEHNLRVLGSYIANEMGQPAPDAAKVCRLSRRIEALSDFELKVIALVDVQTKAMTADTPGALMVGRPFTSAHSLVDYYKEQELNVYLVQYALNELNSRGLLIPDGSSRLDKAEEYYFPSDSLLDLVAKASKHIKA